MVQLNVLVAVDSSAGSRAAVDSILCRAWPVGTKFMVLTVVEPFEPDGPEEGENDRLTTWSSYVEHVKSTNVNKGQELVNVESETIQTALPDCIVETRVVEGYPRETIPEEARSWPADVVVLGTNRKGLVKRIILGSVSQSVLYDCNCAVEVVPSCALSQSVQRVSNVIVALDHSEHSRWVLEATAARPWSDGTTIRLLSVFSSVLMSQGEASAVHMEEVIGEERRQVAVLKNWLKEMRDRLSDSVGPSVHVDLEVLDGDARVRIIDYAQNWPADLIVMGSHGRTGFSRLLMGSVSHSVLLHSPCAVEILKGPISFASESDRFRFKFTESSGVG